MPGINDSPEQVERILDLATEAGATHIGGIALHLRGEVREVFFDWLRSQRPDLVPRYEQLYSRGAYAPPAERQRLQRASPPHPAARPRRGAICATATWPVPPRSGPRRVRVRPSPGRPRCSERRAFPVQSRRRCLTARRFGEGKRDGGRPSFFMRWVRAKASKPLLRPSPLARQLRIQALRQARRARWEVVLLAPALAAVLWAYSQRKELFGVDLPVRIASVIALVILGWAFARSLGRAVGPVLMRRVEPGTAGTLGFLIRLTALCVRGVDGAAGRGVQPADAGRRRRVHRGDLGLAAQQTLGNLIAGTVLLSARPFRVSDRVRFQAGALGGQIEGVVMSLGLLYTTLSQGEDEIMVPNSMVLSAAVVPLREPAAVDLRARLRPAA